MEQQIRVLLITTNQLAEEAWKTYLELEEEDEVIKKKHYEETEEPVSNFDLIIFDHYFTSLDYVQQELELAWAEHVLPDVEKICHLSPQFIAHKQSLRSPIVFSNLTGDLLEMLRIEINTIRSKKGENESIQAA